MNEEALSFVKFAIEILSFIAAGLYAVNRFTARHEILAEKLDRVSDKIETLCEAITDLSKTQNDHNVRLVKLEAVLDRTMKVN
jgi:prefoldin subunit 5